MRANLLMTARGDDDEVGFCGNAFIDGVVGRGVAGVEGDEDVDVTDFVFVDRADDKI